MDFKTRRQIAESLRKAAAAMEASATEAMNKQAAELEAKRRLAREQFRRKDEMLAKLAKDFHEAVVGPEPEETQPDEPDEPPEDQTSVGSGTGAPIGVPGL